MYIDPQEMKKGRVIRERNGRVETVMDGVVVKTTTLGVFMFDPKEQKPAPVWAEFFPFYSRDGMRAITYCE